MQKKFKNIFRIFSLLFIAVFLLTSCEMVPGGTGGDDVVEVTEYMVKAMKFEDKVVEYNGQPHTHVMENPYEKQGVTITHSQNEFTEPGTYTIVATVKFNGKNYNKTASLVIEKYASVLEAETTQTINLKTDELAVKYSIDNEVQKDLVILNELGEEIDITDIAEPGIYNLEVYLKETAYYQESNHIEITINVIASQFDVVFASKKVIADGNEQSVELEGELPEGYSVAYENNTGSVDGKYFALAHIKDSNDEIVETHRAVLIIDNPEHEGFQQYLDEFFVYYLEDDQLSVNIFCQNPANFGLEHYEASWYTFTPFGEEEIAHDLQLFKDMLVELEQFKDAPLNDLQDVAYETLRKFFQYYIDYYSIEDSFYMEVTYVDQFGGYVADFGTYMESYSLRTELEVQDIVDFIESTKEAFPSYLGFLEAKVEQGYPLSDFTISEMQNYLKDLIKQGDDYYLKDILFEKIDGLDFLSDESKEAYKTKISTAISECFVVGVQDLYDGLDEYLGLLPEGEEGYLTQYENGKELYELSLGRIVGYDDLDMEEYIKSIEAELNYANSRVIATQSAIVKKYNITTYAELDKIVAENSIFEGTPNEMLEYLKEFAKTIVPELKSNPDIVVKEMDLAAAKVSNAVAYYMKSALDNTGSEYITLNPVKLGLSSANDVISTLAHEGYPGHLYAYVYSKELGLSNLSTIMTNTGHAEGWATYVELKLYEYAKANSDDEGFDLVMDYLYANQLSGFLLETRIDAGIHYEGWTVEQVGKFMDKLGYNGDAAQSIYDLLIEIPGQYAAYGYGKYIFNKLHNEAKEILGYHYNEIEFNSMLLSKGWTDLKILLQTYEEYMEIKCHEYGIVQE